jgi:hypothetical protein
MTEPECHQSAEPVAYWGGGDQQPPPKFWSFDKAQLNSQFHGKYKPNKNTGFTNLQIERNPWLWDYCQIPVLSVWPLSSTEFVEPPLTKCLGTPLTRVTVQVKLTNFTSMRSFSVRESASVYDLHPGSAEDRRLNLRPQAVMTAVYVVSLSPTKCLTHFLKPGYNHLIPHPFLLAILSPVSCAMAKAVAILSMWRLMFNPRQAYKG